MNGLDGITPISTPKDLEQAEKTVAPPRRSEAAESTKQDDSTSLTARAQAEVTRQQTESERRSTDTKSRPRDQVALPTEMATTLLGAGAARQASSAIVSDILSFPAMAARAQANTAGEGVLNLLR